MNKKSSKKIDHYNNVRDDLTYRDGKRTSNRVESIDGEEGEVD